MSNDEDLKLEDVVNLIKNIEDKINTFSQILQKFGLDIITQFGKTTHNIRILTDKINELDKSAIKIKGLTPQLTKIIDNQDILESDLDLIKSLIQRSNISQPQKDISINNVERDTSFTKSTQAIKNQLLEVLDEIEKADDKLYIIEKLEKIKENIFELTGGHKISYEISQEITKLNNASSLSASLKISIKEKIGFWLNKL